MLLYQPHKNDSQLHGMISSNALQASVVRPAKERLWKTNKRNSMSTDLFPWTFFRVRLQSTNTTKRAIFSNYNAIRVLKLKVNITLQRQYFIGYPNTSNFVKNTPLRVVFSTLFSVFGYPDETLSLVFDILRQFLIFEFSKFCSI